MADDIEHKTEAEIEVTPEMIEAGLPHLYRYHPDRGVDAEDSVKAIFIEMYRVARSCGFSWKSRMGLAAPTAPQGACGALPANCPNCDISVEALARYLCERALARYLCERDGNNPDRVVGNYALDIPASLSESLTRQAGARGAP